MIKKKSTVRPTDRLDVYAGVDAGGSHSEVVLVDSNQREMSRLRGGPAALRPDNADAVARTIAGIVRKARAACDDPAIESIVVAAAGAGRAAGRAALESALKNAGLRERVRVIGDGEATLESAFPGASGLVLISGTGSIAYARDRAGTVHRAGGLGWQLGDEGSGYALGRAGLGATGRAADGRGKSTLLREAIQKATGAGDLDALIQWAQAARREDVAALAPVVGDAASRGDTTARKIVEQAAKELAALVQSLLRRLAPDSPDGIALAGGLLAANSQLRAPVAAALDRVAPGIPILDRTIDPALGAASIATRL